MVLEGEIALVTGATRGIGRAIALQLGACGAHVVGTATSEAGAERIAATLGDAGLTGTGCVLNVTEPGAIETLVRDVAEQFAPISILVNNAGITQDNLLVRMTDEQWDAILDTNLRAVFQSCRAVMRGMMKARRGRVVNIGSVVGTTGNPGQANYAAAKAGLGGFTRSLAQEVASRGITVNMVAPGFIDTDMTKALSDNQRSELAKHIPAGRLGSPDDVAAAVSFLASPQAAYITGQTLHVNGGMFMD